MDVEGMLEESAPADRFSPVAPGQFRELSRLAQEAARVRRRGAGIRAGIAVIALALMGGGGAALASTLSSPAPYAGTVPSGDGTVVFAVDGSRVSCGVTFFITSADAVDQENSSVTVARASVRRVDLQAIVRTPAFRESTQLEQQPSVLKIPDTFSSTLSAQERALQVQVTRSVETSLRRAGLPASVALRPEFTCDAAAR